MKTLKLKTSTENEFFARGIDIARRADGGVAMPEELTVSFEDPSELLKLLSTARLDVFRAIKERPDSITGVAQRLSRDRSAVKRDIDQLAEAGLVTIEIKSLPGHGRQKEVRPVADRFRLEAVLA